MVLVHDAFGSSDDMQEQADWLAAGGYVVAMPDLYRGKRAISCLKGTFAQLTAQRGPAFDQIEATRERLAASPDCTGAVGVIGYCMGGAFALLLAGRPGWAASSVNYGQMPDNVDEVLAGACPVVASYGGRDRYLRGAAATLESALTERGVDHDVKEYPGAGHAFLNTRDTSPWYLAPMPRLVLRVGPDPVASADAWARMEGFLGRHLTS